MTADFPCVVRVVSGENLRKGATLIQIAELLAADL